MRNVSFWAVFVLVLVTLNGLIVQKERLLSNGQTLLLRLAPRDPRSLIQGDYMVLRYEIAAKAESGQTQPLPRDGYLVVRIDPQGVADLVRIHGGETLEPGERLLRFRNRDGVRLGAESFFFQEGHADLYTSARYGELKVTSLGDSVLVGLRGEELEPLGPGRPASRPTP